MISVKVKRAIFDSEVARQREVGETFTMTLERKEQVSKLIPFDSYFEVVEIKKQTKKRKV